MASSASLLALFLFPAVGAVAHGPSAPADAPVPHVELRASDPGADAVLERAPDRIVLHFTGEIQTSLARIEVTGPDGRSVAVGPVAHPDPASVDRLAAAVPRDLGPGEYAVSWRATAPDGHVVEGTFRFRIARAAGGAPLQPGPAAGGRTPDAPGEQATGPRAGPGENAAPEAGGLLPPGTGTRWLRLLGVVLFLGVAASRYGVLPLVVRDADLEEVGARLRRGYWRAGWLALALLLVALPLHLWLEFRAGGPEWTAAEITDRLFTTAWGGGWFLQLGAVVLGGIGLVLAGRNGEHPRGWAVLGAAALLLPLGVVLQGHAMGLEALRGVGIAAHFLHVLAVGMWLGGLLLLVTVGLAAVRAETKRRKRAGAGDADAAEALAEGPSPDAEDDSLDGAPSRPPLARVVNAFSRMALPVVALFLLSGATLSWLHTGGSLALYTGSGWGRTLLLKVGLVLGILALGFYNWRRVRPGLVERPDPGALRIPASVEAVLGLLVLLVTAVLVATPLP